jgi:hypothetical protein
MMKNNSGFVGVVEIEGIILERSTVIRATFAEAQKDAMALVDMLNERYGDEPAEDEDDYGPITYWDASVIVA